MMNPIVKEISAVRDNPEDVYVIHCSQYINENRNVYPKRVSCIYLQNLNGSESQRFSLEKFASKNGIEVAGIEDWYDELEYYVLDEFNTFLRTRSHCTFIYWLEEGHGLVLDCVKERYDELNKEEDKQFHTLSPSNRKTVQYLVKKVYPSSDNHKELKQFIKYYNHDQVVPGYLNAAEESVCFDKKEFQKIETSVVAKVTFFVSLINDCAATSPLSQKDANIDPVDLQSLSPLALMRRLSLKSWGWLIGIFIASGGIGTWIAASKINDLKDQNIQLRVELDKQKKQYEDSLNLIQNNRPHK
jgi:hypothetical protein